MFFSKKDSDQQGLDINIGRVLEMFNTGVLGPDQARDAVAKFFGGEAQKDVASLNRHLSRILICLNDGTMDTNNARMALVNAAAASEKHDPHYADLLEHTAG